MRECVRECVSVCVSVCMSVCVRVCVRSCVRACVSCRGVHAAGPGMHYLCKNLVSTLSVYLCLS